ncbi:hypothetical protein TNCV_4446011 [Trichonephila clavipes]|nr:hypothetical protein TNCV_4446011 [Trichonephila clavipes]
MTRTIPELESHSPNFHIMPKCSKRSNCKNPSGGASVTESSEVLGVSRDMVSKVIIIYTQRDKKSLVKQNSGRKGKFSERDRRVLKRIAMPKNQTTTAKVTAELN